MTTQIRTGNANALQPKWLVGLGSAVVDLLFPPYCVACHRFGNWFCAQCQQEIEVLRPPLCGQCGLPIAASDPTPHAGGPPVVDASRLCARCQETPLACLGGLRAYAYYSGPLREAIHQFKYKDLRSLGPSLGRMMEAGWSWLSPAARGVDAIVPVPLHSSRHRQRGYNQAALLARELGQRLGLPVVEDALVRTRATAPQVDLNVQERRDNVQGAFQVGNSTLADKRVLLVDDVCTTGSTLEAACDALHQGGVSSVWAYTLARAKPGNGSRSG